MTAQDEKKSSIRDAMGSLAQWLRPGARSSMETSAGDKTAVAFADRSELNAPTEQDLVENTKKIGSVLSVQDQKAETDEERLDAQELYKEVITLKEELKDLHARYINSGIISDRELSLEEENKRFQRRERDHRVQLRIARENLKVLRSTREQVRSLRARNSLMRSRIDNQSRLLQGMAEGNPRHEGSMSRINSLTEENRRLQTQLEGQAELLSRFQMRIPADLRQSVADLTSRNDDLLSMWKDKSAEFDTVITREGGGIECSLIENIENLAQENTHLKKLIETRQVIGSFIKGEGEAESSDPKKAVEALRMENQLIEAALEVREEEMKTFARPNQDRPLMKALVIRSEYQELLRDNAHKDQIYRQLAGEKRELEKRYSDRHVLIRENHKLKVDLETMGQLISSLRKREARYQTLNRESSVLRGQYDASQDECKVLR